jgi:excinuclease ABC subunit B
MTGSIEATIRETVRRREIQRKYNKENNITPESIKKDITNIMGSVYEHDYMTIPVAAENKEAYLTGKDLSRLLKKLKKEMLDAAKNLEFEKAADIRDRILELEKAELEI